MNSLSLSRELSLFLDPLLFSFPCPSPSLPPSAPAAAGRLWRLRCLAPPPHYFPIDSPPWWCLTALESNPPATLTLAAMARVGGAVPQVPAPPYLLPRLLINTAATSSTCSSTPPRCAAPRRPRHGLHLKPTLGPLLSLASCRMPAGRCPSATPASSFGYGLLDGVVRWC